jgi:hypothetical protein
MDARILLFVPLGGLHLIFTPWLFASHPIKDLKYYEIDNEPAPPEAKSFAINHGSAIYYVDSVPADHPEKRNLIFGIALALWLGLLVVGFRAYRRSKALQ